MTAYRETKNASLQMQSVNDGKMAVMRSETQLPAYGEEAEESVMANIAIEAGSP